MAEPMSRDFRRRLSRIGKLAELADESQSNWWKDLLLAWAPAGSPLTGGDVKAGVLAPRATELPLSRIVRMRPPLGIRFPTEGLRKLEAQPPMQ